MKRLLTAAMAAAVLLALAGSALAFTHYPNASCTDTLSIFQLKNTLNVTGSCNPATNGTAGVLGDTVNGVGGIIIGFDEIPTGFDIYLQQSSGGPLTGIDCFTHGTNFRAPYGFNLGDSVVVEYAGVANYFGDVELEAPNNNFSGPNIVLRKVSAGNPLPPFFIGTTTDLRETPTNTVIAPYMSGLVHLNGPLRVARLGGATSTTPLPGGDTKLGIHGMLVVDANASNPPDSVFIDYNKLTTIVPPALGTILTSIQGVVNSASRGWRIMPRGAGDIVDVVPPSISDSYAIADNQYRLVYDRDVTSATATNAANYSLASFGSVDAVAMDGTNAVIMNVTTSLLHGESETITVNGVTGSANNVTMTTPVSISFLAGVLSCGEMSAPNTDSLAADPCRDLSKYAGTGSPTGQFVNGPFGPRSTVTGIVAAQYGNLYYLEDAAPASARGLTVFAPPQALTLGHRYVIAGADEEYKSENEFAAITYVKDVGVPGAPAPVVLPLAVAALDVCDASQIITSGRDYLSDLIQLQNVAVVPINSGNDPAHGFLVIWHGPGPDPGPPDTMFVENQNNVLGTYVTSNPNYPAVNSVLNVTGVLHYAANTTAFSRRDGFSICPRSAADITLLGVLGVGGQLTPKELSFAVYPNPARVVSVSFTLPKAADVQLNVYDLLGRQVAQLAKGQMEAGTYQKSWTGLDDSGNRVHSGVYFYRLRAGNDVRTARTMLLGN